jgi:hypothetical protein
MITSRTNWNGGTARSVLTTRPVGRSNVHAVWLAHAQPGFDSGIATGASGSCYVWFGFHLVGLSSFTYMNTTPRTYADAVVWKDSISFYHIKGLSGAYTGPGFNFIFRPSNWDKIANIGGFPLVNWLEAH